MSRYTYYHVLYVGMINIMMFVPTMLIRDRFQGAISGMLIAMVIGSVIAYVMMASFEKFPGLGFPEICDRYIPRWLTVTLSLMAGLLIWLPAGTIVIFAFSETVRMFFYPDMNPYLNLFLMVSAGVWASSRSTRSVQFIHEIMMLIISPLLLLFLIKAIVNDSFNWDAVRYVAGYVNKPPSFVSMASATFLFSGHFSLFLLNRLHVEGFRFRFRWIVPLFGCFFLLVTFFVPIGFHGTVGVGDYVYLWSMTADSMIMEYGFINRVLFVFLLLFTGLSLLFVMNTWHTTIMLIRYSINRSVALEEDPVPNMNKWLALGAGILSFVFMRFVSLEMNQVISETWLVARFFMEFLFLFMMLYFVWRKKKENVCA
ncbi:hypothetical protein [Paenibacillus planticolens]|uniref:Spore germination protein n=1 Tax=Paenibacillus planticolens TaxID=2654976 RepID=A0ABX2A126_9BACL|nr:hypothetical protein [Paenibacillus planticolens]NOV04695.1 hypothetical protein [Paenibacillus planticolens]